MRERWSWSRLPLLVLLIPLVAACASPPRPAWAPAPITGVASVSGKWAGLLLREPPDVRDDWLEVIIQPDGSYQARSYREIGELSGSGRIAIADGKLKARTERGTDITAALYTAPEGRRMLRMEATTREGVSFRSELEPDR